jgi:GNAT superfamily N-acetyltransferase
VTDIEIRPSRYLAPTVRALVAAAMADLGARYGSGGDETPIEAIEFDPPDGAFFVAWRDGVAVGCVGWRSHDESEDVAELKRLFVDPAARGLGVAMMLLAAAEESAADHGRVRMILECGEKQPEAIALYGKAGYTPIPHFGFYRDAPEVRSFGRDLGGPA